VKSKALCRFSATGFVAAWQPLWLPVHHSWADFSAAADRTDLADSGRRWH
jgi:hypothetical protein